MAASPAFPSTLPLAGHEEDPLVTRRSSATTSRPPNSLCFLLSHRRTLQRDASLAEDGLSLPEDGRVFTTKTNSPPATPTTRKDAYEWEPQETGGSTSSSPTFAAPRRRLPRPHLRRHLRL